MEGDRLSLQAIDDAFDRRHRLKPVLDTVYRASFRVQSEYARSNAELVACAASLGLITTQLESDVFGRDWRITAKGLRWLNEMKELN
jgi:hypothetical protein